MAGPYWSHLAFLEGDASGFVDEVKLRLRLNRARKAYEEGQWSDVFNQFYRLAESLEPSALPAKSWRVLAALYGVAAARSNQPLGRTPHFECMVVSGWPNRLTERGDALSDFERVLYLLEEPSFFKAGSQLGDLLGRFFPRHPLGFFASAHFDDLWHAWHRPLNSASWIDGILRKYRRAINLSKPDTTLGQLARLRGAALAVAHGVSDRRTEELWHDLRLEKDASWRLSLWHGLWLTRSARWLKRIRGYDLLEHWTSGVATLRPEYLSVNLETLLPFLSTVLSQPPHIGHPLEEDRRDSLRDAASVSGHLVTLCQISEQSDQLARQGDQSLEDDRCINMLREFVLRDSERWREPLEWASRLRKAYCGDGEIETVEEESDLDRYAVCLAEVVCQLSLRANPADDLPAPDQSETKGSATDHLLQTLEDLSELHPLVFAEQEMETFSRYRRPENDGLAVVWPVLFGFLEVDGRLQSSSVLSRPSELDKSRSAGERNASGSLHPGARLAESVKRLMRSWLARAPAPPTYGFWALASHCVNAGFFEAAHGCAQRAVEGQGLEEVNAELREFVVWRLIDWAIKEGSEGQIRFWLEVGYELECGLE